MAENQEVVQEVVKKKIVLENDVRLNVFVIGVGNAGNQAIVLGKKEGLNVFAINSSIKDLSDQVVDQTIPSFIVGKEGRGSGKNVEKGLMLWKENRKDLFQIDRFISSCQEADVIAVISATGGGTGPSISPEICISLKKLFPKKIVMYHGITPKNSDSNTSFANTSYCLNEIKKLEIPYSLTDLNFFEEEKNDVAFLKADKHAIDTIKAIGGYYLNMSSSQMIDENDLRTIISEPGYIAAYQVDGVTSSVLEKHTMQELLIEKIRKGPAMMIQKDGISMQMGIIANFPDDLMETSRSGNYNEIFDFIGHKPKNGIFENYAVTNGTEGQMIVLISGMTYPINRLRFYIEEVKKQDEFLLKKKDISVDEDVEYVTGMLSSGTDRLSSNSKLSEEELDSALDDLFD